MSVEVTTAAANPEGFTTEELAAWNAQVPGNEGPQAADPTPPAGAPEPQRTSTEPAAPSPQGAAAPGQTKEPPAPGAQAPAGEEEDGIEEIATPNGKPRRMVNYGALHQARMELKREREERATERVEATRIREERAAVNERLRLLSEAMAPQQPEEQGPPDPEKDPFGAIRWLYDQQQRAGQRTEQVADTLAETSAEASLRQSYEGDALQFAQQQPDFGLAYNHLQSVRDKMLENIGYTDPKERLQIRINEEKALVQRALKAGRRPAEVIYSVSKSLGYQMPAAAPPAQPTAPVAPAAPANGAAAVQPAAPAAPAAPSVTDEITRLQNGQRAAKSLSVGGGAPGGQITVEMLANMTDDQFKAVMRKNPKLVDELMGAA
jgi:hypothetical protein